VEKMITFNQTKRRIDLVVFNKSAQSHILVECKATDVTLDEKACTQIGLYQYSLPCQYLLITNGLQHFVFEKSSNEEQTFWNRIEGLPKYN